MAQTAAQKKIGGEKNASTVINSSAVLFTIHTIVRSHILLYAYDIDTEWNNNYSTVWLRV